MIRKRRTGALAIAMILAVTATGIALAQNAGKKTARKQQVSAQAAATQTAQPDSPRSQKNAARLSVMLNRSVEDLNAVTLPDGTQMIDLDGGFQNVAMASFDANGQLVVTCVDDLAAAEALLQRRAVARPATSKAKDAGKKNSLKPAPVAAEEK